ncbi:monofunctional biosynthetic peptidoglycan transglycosylase [soil metagenome]
MAWGKRRKGFWGWIGLLLRYGFTAVAGFFTLCLLLLVLYRFVNPPTTTVQIQRWVESLGGESDYSWRYRPLSGDAIDRDLRNAVVAAEDARFFQHNGFDWVEVRRAREDARRRGRQPRGASTLTQQLVKNLFLTTHRSWIRKGFEVPLTFMAELVLPKDRILTLYLNVVEWGPEGVFGAEAGAQHHYNTSASRLSREQAARMAAVLPDPRRRRPQNAGQYSRTILTRMWQMGY